MVLLFYFIICLFVPHLIIVLFFIGVFVLDCCIIVPFVLDPIVVLFFYLIIGLFVLSLIIVLFVSSITNVLAIFAFCGFESGLPSIPNRIASPTGFFSSTC